MPYATNNKISQDPIEGGVEITKAQYAQALEGVSAGWIITVVDGAFKCEPPESAPPPQPPAPTEAEIIAAKIAALEAKVQDRLDAKARSMNFDSILSGITNASLPSGEYRQADGAALLLWRARTWQKAAEIRDAFLSGERREPTWDEVNAELPEYPIV
jgi:hypothetical protein